MTAGAQAVNTSTGLLPNGGATVEVVRLLARFVGDRGEVKASGGIGESATANAMIQAGAKRIGTSLGDQIAKIVALEVAAPV